MAKPASPFAKETSDVKVQPDRSDVSKSVPVSQPDKGSDFTSRDLANIVSFFVDDGTTGGEAPTANTHNTDITLQAMERYGAPFKLTKTPLLATIILLLGFLIKNGRRHVAPGKRQTAKAWTV